MLQGIFLIKKVPCRAVQIFPVKAYRKFRSCLISLSLEGVCAGVAALRYEPQDDVPVSEKDSLPLMVDRLTVIRRSFPADFEEMRILDFTFLRRVLRVGGGR